MPDKHVTASRNVARDATLLVALAAVMWGLDGLLRKPLATALDAGTVVLWEHIIALIVLAPTVPGALRAFTRISTRDKIAVVVIGVGSSAVATALFTRAFAISGQTGDYVTPLVLQKLQPVAAVLLAVLLLRERPRWTYAVFAVPALFGAWLLTFSDPWHVRIAEAEPALYALGAALLWGAGTVLGRMVGFSLSPAEVTALRFFFGLIGAVAVVWVTDAGWAPGWHNMVGLVLLALIPGVIALRLYYYALARTPASRATLAELAFPATAAIVGVVWLDSHLERSQWLGFGIVVLAVLALSVHENSQRPSVEATVPEPVTAGSQ